MTKPASEKPIRGKPLFTSYTVIWSMLGVLGLSYLGIAIFEPAWLGDLTPASARNGALTEEAMLNLATDAAGLRSSMAKLQLDVASVKADVTSQAGQTQLLGTQLSALEDKVRLGQTTIASAAVPAPSAAEQRTAETASTTSMGAMDADSEPAAKPGSKGTKIINAGPAQPGPIVTGSVEPRAGTSKAKNSKDDVISFGPAVVKPTAKPIGIEIGSGPSVDGLRLSWSQLTEQNNKLKKLTARYADNGDTANPGFNLIAGPVKSKSEAIRICKDLISHYQTCKVGEFKGDDL